MSCHHLSELSESQIDAMRSELLKRQRLFLTEFDLNQLPATTPDLHPVNATPGAVVAGASYMEKNK
ncbi:hypothetical protein SAMN04487785_11428 [Dyella jiangningensis]|uniref:hypothetical protein n=1 Tax=Dyella sp. AtDHG13 TaxID=1938897 RepID=UPI000887E1B3|nr:hypothetical protein [Dyella sp. AtDHG13]PXV54192.1 hypothetical protein BDW41_113145 [Dyella sp. AtDHG13]SDL04625.1 hypothetical protein SAMN04487785_11428 [Dyella jiangningensis]